MTKKVSLLKSIFSFSISSWVNIVVGFFYTIISTRLLLPDTYGMISMFMSAGNTIMYIVCLGLDASFIRFFNERPNNEPQNIFSYKLLLLISCNGLIVFLISTIFFFDWFNKYLFGRLSWFLTVMLFTSVYSHLFLRFFNIIYRMSFKAKQYTIQNVLIQSGTKTLILIAALYNPRYEIIIAFQVLGILGITIIYSIIQRKDIFPTKGYNLEPPRSFFNGYSTVIKYALFSAPLQICFNIYTLLTQQVLRFSLGETALGIFAAVSVFSTLFGVIESGFSIFWSAFVYTNYNREQNKISLMTDYIMLVAIISLSGFVLFRKVLYLFIGVKYQSSIYFFSMVLMVSIFRFLEQATVHGINIAKKNYISAITNCFYILLTVIAVYYLANRYGLVGAGIAVMSTRLLLFVVDSVIAQNYYKTIISWKRFLIGLLFLLFMAISPALKVKDIYTYVFVIILIMITLFIYKNQFLYILNLGKKQLKLFKH